MHRSLIGVAMIIAASGSNAQAQRPLMPRIRVAPCEHYCSSVWASCLPVSLRSAPIETASIVARVDSGQLVRVIAGERRTTQPGVVVVRHSHTLVQRLSSSNEDYTPPNPKHWRLRKGDTLFIVDKQTDGDSYVDYVWVYKNMEDTTAAFWPDGQGLAPDGTRNVRLHSMMVQDWWAQVRTPSGITGWTRPGDEWTGTSYYDDPVTKCARGNAPL